MKYMILQKLKFFNVLLSAIFLFIGGCVSAHSIGQSWIGKSESLLLTKWGAPSRTSETGDKKIHTWDIRNGYGQVICQQTMVIQNQRVLDHSSDCGLGF